MYTLWRLALVSVFALALGACKKDDPVSITDLVIREAPPGSEVASAYMRMRNNDNKTYILNYVHSDIADHIEVHRHIYANGKMEMRPVPDMPLDAKATVDFKPGGYHLMLFGLQREIKVGDKIPIVFEFEKLKPITVVAEVKRL